MHKGGVVGVYTYVSEPWALCSLAQIIQIRVWSVVATGAYRKGAHIPLQADAQLAKGRISSSPLLPVTSMRKEARRRPQNKQQQIVTPSPTHPFNTSSSATKDAPSETTGHPFIQSGACSRTLQAADSCDQVSNTTNDHRTYPTSKPLPLIQVMDLPGTVLQV